MKKTVTIGISAHNEEKNIASLLETLVQQKEENFKLQKIIVACDGCTDNTAVIVKKMAKKYSVIQCLDDHKRRGKTTRMNAFYKNLKSNIFISFDADVKILDTRLLSKLVQPFEDKKVGLVGGRVSILSQNTLIGKILETQEYFWTLVVESIDKGNNLQSHTGPVSAGSREFLKKIKRPSDIVADDHFLYFAAMKNNFLYKAVKNLQVYITVPATFSDYMKQSHRFFDSADQLRTYFGDWTNKHYRISYSKKLLAYGKTLLKSPVYMPLALVLTSMQKVLQGFYKTDYKDGIWTTVKSTK